MTNPVQPVIVVKKKGGHAAHHGGAWKVAYADFVTAMMAFFLVMWLVNQSKPVKAAIGGYFRDPAAFDASGGRGVLPGGDTVNPPKPATPTAEQEERKRMEAAVMHIREGLDKDAFASLRDQVEFTITPEGLRIDLMDKDDSMFFDSGSASLHGETEHILGVIAHELGSLDHQVDLEGHTDSRGYTATDKYSNWELSADRANAARRVMERGWTAWRAGDERERSCGSSASIPGRSVRRTKSTSLDPGEEPPSQDAGGWLRGSRET